MDALNRQEFGQMLAFALAVIPTEDKTEKNCLFVKIENGVYHFTAGGAHCMKRVSLPSQTTITSEESVSSFMIPRGSLKGFSEIMKDHKSKIKKLEKGNESRLFIMISGNKLESIDEDSSFGQPDYQFKDLQPYFEQKQTPSGVVDYILKPGEIENVMAGFSKTKPLIATHCTMEGDINLIHYKQKRDDDIDYEAVFICPSEVVEEKEDDENKQTEIDD